MKKIERMILEIILGAGILIGAPTLEGYAAEANEFFSCMGQTENGNPAEKYSVNNENETVDNADFMSNVQESEKSFVDSSAEKSEEQEEIGEGAGLGDSVSERESQVVHADSGSRNEEPEEDGNENCENIRQEDNMENDNSISDANALSEIDKIQHVTGDEESRGSDYSTPENMESLNEMKQQKVMLKIIH